METRTVNIPSISCGHCKATIERELGELDGVEKVSVDVATQTASVAWQPPASWPVIEETLAEIGYAPQATPAAGP